VACALRAARVPGRFEIREGPVEVVLDVAHNPQAAGTLADALVERASANRTRLVLAMYRDKDAAGVVGALAGVVDAWFTAPLPPPRGADAATLGEAIAAAAGCRASAFRDPPAALQAAMAESLPGDRVVVAGSFETVAAVSRWLDG
jgi:dihydrofolate synthase/folylpolyglutamate synthase